MGYVLWRALVLFLMMKQFHPVLQMLKLTNVLLNLLLASVVLDLCKANGNPKSTTSDTFWREGQAYLDEITLAVDDRRHGETLHMPLAIPVCHLRK